MLQSGPVADQDCRRQLGTAAEIQRNLAMFSTAMVVGAVVKVEVLSFLCALRPYKRIKHFSGGVLCLSSVPQHHGCGGGILPEVCMA